VKPARARALPTTLATALVLGILSPGPEQLSPLACGFCVVTAAAANEPDPTTTTTSTSSTTLPTIDCFREIAPEYAAVDVPSLIQVRTDADVARVRTALLEEIWKTPQLPSTLPDTITIAVPNPLPDLTPPPGTRVDELTVQMGEYVARSYLLTPPRARRRLVIVHQGHSHVFGAGNLGTTAQALLEQRYVVVAAFMPLFGTNGGPFPPWPLLHDPMAFAESPDFNPISIFLEPVVRTVNYAATSLRIKHIAMLGLSGGGWTTTLMAALDPRIRISVAVAGSRPRYLSTPPCATGYWPAGDYEQQAHYTTIADYLDLYVLGSVGRRRGHLQVLNQFDACCFAGIAYRTYEEPVLDAVAALRGRYAVYLDSSHLEHQVSPDAFTRAVEPFLRTRRLPRR